MKRKRKSLWKYYYYVTEKENVIRIMAKKRPSPYTQPKSGTWVVREFHDGAWHIPCFPEIVWGILKELKYIGKKDV